MAGNPVRVSTVTFSSPSKAERQMELSDHGGDNLQQNPSTTEQTGNPMDEHENKDKVENKKHNKALVKRNKKELQAGPLSTADTRRPTHLPTLIEELSL